MHEYGRLAIQQQHYFNFNTEVLNELNRNISNTISTVELVLNLLCCTLIFSFQYAVYICINLYNDIEEVVGGSWLVLVLDGDSWIF